MPRVYLCPLCPEKVTDDQEFTLAERNGETIRTHVECAKKKATSPKPAAGVVPVTSWGSQAAVGRARI